MHQDLNLTRLRDSYRRGLSPVEVARAVGAAIDACGDPGIFISRVDPRMVEAKAAALGAFDPSKPLYGAPFAVKDNIDVAGIPTTAACPGFAYVPARSAPAVEQLEAAGAILIGKTNLDQFATGLVGVRTPYPVPRNACDRLLVPGGSSSGSAVAVALGLVSFALGTDTAGSGRVPAALNNIVGLKPSRGMISTRGVVPACRTLDCVSVFAGSVADAWSILSLARGYDPADPYSRRLPFIRPALPPVIRVGVPDASSRIFGSQTASAAFDAFLEKLGNHASVGEVDLSLFFEAGSLLYESAWVAERYAGIRDFVDAHADDLHPVTRRIIEGGRRPTGADAFAGQYRLADLLRRSQPIWEEIDILMVPSVPDVCTLAEVAGDPLGANARLGVYTNFVNLLDLCAIAVPGPFRGDGRPAGATLIAPAGRDGLLAALGERLHQAAGVPVGATRHRLPEAPEAPSSAPPGSIEVAVVGAHLSGMSLNAELLSRGASFVRSAQTLPEYRLFALAGGPPQRPGLVRVGKGGASIETEVWALPPEGFGAFVAAVPAPLAIGTLRLADGTSPKGFLCEAVAATEARDISSFGGWRAFVAAG